MFIIRNSWKDILAGKTVVTHRRFPLPPRECHSYRPNCFLLVRTPYIYPIFSPKSHIYTSPYQPFYSNVFLPFTVVSACNFGGPKHQPATQRALLQEEIRLLQQALQSLQDQHQLSPEEIAEALGSYQDRGVPDHMGRMERWTLVVGFGWWFLFVSVLGGGG